MFIKDFYNNPSGKGSTVLNISAIKAQFDKRYENDVSKIRHKVYHCNKMIYIHIKVPSSVKDIYYDVVLKFTPNSKSAGVSITDMDMELFSNSPSFIFTFANAYNKKHIFISELKRKLSRQILTTVAQQKNPYQVLSYDYSIYYGLKYVLSNELTDVSKITENADKYFTNLLKNIPDWESIQKNRKIQKDYIKAQSEEELKKRKKEQKDIEKETVKSVKPAKIVKNTAKVKTISKRKSVSKSKPVSKVKTNASSSN